VGQVSKDFDLTKTAVRVRVKQAERDAGTCSGGGLTRLTTRGSGRTPNVTSRASGRYER
jgi:hypothetical protein